jgi:hypothetical protein
VTISALRPRRHDPPLDWGTTTFERVTDALAAALVASYGRAEEARAEEARAEELGA